MFKSKTENKKITIVGLGYVGLPLAVEFGKKYKTVGFDIDIKRVQELKKGHDHTLEIEANTLKEVVTENLIEHETNIKGLYFTADFKEIKDSNFFIVTVPTPTDKNNQPDLTPLLSASKNIGRVLKKGDYVIYESTVYPGVTEEECVPVLEKTSGLILNDDFFVGYSPERINPGDKERTIAKIRKVTSGSNKEAAEVINSLYQDIIAAGTYLAPSIKVAEASKLIENCQRDINIAFINELAKIFNKLNIDTYSVLKAAETKWNFLPFKPGLVGGHCIGVDPYYLTQKAQDSGYYPEIILAARRINDSMGSFVASEIVKKMVHKNINIKGSKALILGFSFKENCPDIRNTRVIDIYWALKEFGLDVIIYDPWVNQDEVERVYGLSIDTDASALNNNYSTIILAVGHDQFKKLNLESLKKQNCVVYDIKGFYDLDKVDKRL
ncbi:MAG: nucleotide sugar dehydrogenase [Bacteroidota bacterium]|nr:nucleotide sugar dehydrogenase [Bacteroidota bacterium]